MILRFAALLLSGQFVLPAIAGTHPRYLLTADDLPRIRHACGVSDPATNADWGRHGWAADDYRAVRAATLPALESVAAGDTADDTIPGELIASAFMHALSPTDARDPQRIQLITAALRRQIVLTDGALERVIALDWCWETIDPAVRRNFLLNLREQAKPLRFTDSPIDHRAFRERLTLLIAATLFDEGDENSPSWNEYRKAILEGGKAWIEKALPGFLAMRGGIPTCPATAADEECDTALLLEVAALLDDKSAWKAHGPRVGRWFEHYLFESDSRFTSQFIRDDGSSGPLLPIQTWAGMQPVTAHLIAGRTSDPSAVWVARQCFARGDDATREQAIERDLWRWVPILFPLQGVSPADTKHLPAMRNLDGAIVFRGKSGELPIAIWCDAGQRFLRSRQHFDAGNFLVRCGGSLIVDAAEDIVFDASISRGGKQHLGRERDSFDFEQFLSGTISHNCMNFWEPTRALHWRGKRYLVLGGQTPLDPPVLDCSQPGSARETSRLIAAGSRDDVAYAAVDLGASYDPRDVSRYRREFMFHAAGLLIVVDRVELTDRRVSPTWILNIPAKPTIDGRALKSDERVLGGDDNGGAWRIENATSIGWGDRGGNIRLHPILPEARKTTVVGGPAARIALDGSPDVKYLGGDADGFERLINPCNRATPQNAWYRLGLPPRASAEVLGEPRWGRVEIESATAAREHVFLSALLITADASGDAGELSSSDGPDFHEVRWTNRGRQIAIRVPSNASGGSVTDSDGSPWNFPDSVQEPEPLRRVQP